MSYTELVLGNRFRSRVGLVREASSLELLAERNVVGSLPQNPHPVYFSKVILARATDYNGPKLAHMLFRLKGAVIRCELHRNRPDKQITSFWAMRNLVQRGRGNVSASVAVLFTADRGPGRGHLTGWYR